VPLTVSCFSKIQIGFTFLVPAHPGSPGKGPLNRCVFVANPLQRCRGTATPPTPRGIARPLAYHSGGDDVTS